MTDDRLPDLPSDEELGIDGLDEEELLREFGERGPEPPPPSGDSRPEVPPAGTKASTEGAPSRPRKASAPPKGPPAPSRPAPATPAGRGPRWVLALVSLLALLGGAWASGANRALPPPLPANAPATTFSSARAMTHLVELARAPRPVGAPEHTRARELVLGWLRDLGLEPEVHESLSVRRVGAQGVVSAVTVRNIVARIPGTRTATGAEPGAGSGPAAGSGRPAILLTAHYDAVPLSHGAGDDGLGVVAIVETVRALLASEPLANDVILLITDAEELGLLGARAFVEEHPWLEDVRVVLSAEMRGGGGPVYMFETGADNGWIVRALQASDTRPVATSFSVEVYRRLPNDTDFTPFREAGIQGMNLAGIGRAWVYHQPTDRPENLDEATLQHMGDQLLGITRELGGRDLARVHAPDLVYLTLPVLGILAYPVGMALPVSAGVLLLWIGLCFLVLRRGGGAVPGTRGAWGVLAGFGVILLAAGLAALAGWALLGWLPRFHPEYGTMTPAFHGEGWYVAALVALAAALLLALVGVARRFVALPALAAGALLPLVLLAVGAALVAPLVALEFQVPAVAGTLAVAVLAVVGGGAGAAPDRWGGGRIAALVIGLLLAVPVLVSMVPLVEGIWIAMSFRLAVGLAILVVLALSALLPALEGLAAPNRWWAPLAGVVVAAALVATGVLQAGASESRPLPSTLLYTLDRESGEALWATRDDAGLDWAEEQVGPVGPPLRLERFPLPLEYRTAPAPALDPEPPVVEIEGAGELGMPGAPGTRRVLLRVRSRLEAEIVSVALAGSGGGPLPAASFLALDGELLPQGPPGEAGARRSVTRVTHQGVPRGGGNDGNAGNDGTDRPGGLLFVVEVDRGLQALEVIVVEEQLRPAELLGPDPFRRPPYLVPSPGARSDRMLVRTRVTLPLVPGSPVPDSGPPDEPDPPPGAPSPGASEGDPG
ncbi:MAG: M28 family peptidase [Gemmatimonadales bacterium]|nr:MAG: M28 family peptidase [Gemmatimonadales bacterium]